MSGRKRSTRAQAEHYRQLAEWTGDARTQQILTEMARELEEAEGEAEGLEMKLRALADVPCPGGLPAH